MNFKEELANKEQELSDLNIKYQELIKKYEYAKNIIKTMHQTEIQISDIPKRFEGFSLRRDNKGYIRGYKSCNGKMKSIYIGREFSEEKVKEKISRIS